MIPINNITIETLKERRFVKEQSLALELLDVFNNVQYGLIGALRNMADNALSLMLEAPGGLMESIGVVAGTNAEQYLAIWGDTQVTGPNGNLRIKKMENIRRNINSLTASQCSDIIRLYGAVVEEWGKRAKVPKARMTQQNELKKQYRPDLDQGTMIWDDAHRVRESRPKGYKAPGLEKAFTSPTPVSGIDLKYATATDMQYNIGGKSVRGISMSTVLKIDKAFGLPVGADISGTTADSIFFIERFMRRCNMRYDPIFQLLALATLVSHRHHALLEVALTMTLNNKITGVTYSIGFFKTLLPPMSRDSLYGNAYAKIRNVLEYYEKEVQHFNILVYFDPVGKLIGGYNIEQNELTKFKELAATGKTFMWRWATMPGFPTKLRIDSIARDYGLGIP